MVLKRLTRFLSGILPVWFAIAAPVHGMENGTVTQSAESIQAAWLTQYDELKLEIGTSLAKRASSPEVDDRYIADRNALILPGDRDPLDVVVRRTGALLNNLKRQYPAQSARFSVHEKRLAAITSGISARGLGKVAAATETSRMELYLQTCALRRELLITLNPAVDFDTLVFVGWKPVGGDSHMCDQWYGWNAANGGGLYKLAGIKSSTSATTADYFLVRFSGTQIRLYGRKNPGHGIAAVSIDGGTETNADFYAASDAVKALVYTSPVLASGNHTLKVKVTGTKNSASSGYYVVADFVTVTSSTTDTVNDRTTGTGLNQFDYQGAWATHTFTGSYNNDETYHLGNLTPSSGNTTLVDILAKSTVQNGRLAGKSLTPGEFISPDLSYDGKIILFSWSTSTDKCYHIFKVSTDGSNLTQLTDGQTAYNANPLRMNQSKNDFDPCWLPSGRIAFISERRGGYLRCSGARPCPTYALYSMKADGSDIFPLSYHETNEWSPSVNNDGMIVYTRWDYIDRDDCIAHHIWTCGPDGTNPRAPHGNYPDPQSTQTGTNWSNDKYLRPNAEWQIRAIPGSQKYVAIAGPHHGHHFGQIVVLDVNVRDDNKMAQVKGITSSQTNWPDGGGPYGTVWPLSETVFLCNKGNSLIVRDAAGNEEVLYTSATFRPLEPIPLKSRTKPNVIAAGTWQGDRASLNDHYRATISIMNVYESDLPLPKGVSIKALRIIQVFPQQQPIMNAPRIGYAGESLVRMPIGTVPVEADGSAYFEAPVGKEIYFQLLDSLGCAVQSMRSGTYVHAGEQMTCYGCHEDKWKAVPVIPAPLALKRAPSKIAPEAGGLEPINFHRLVRPIFTAKCAGCHTKEAKGPAMDYWSLVNYAFYWPSNTSDYLGNDIVSPIHGGSRTIPGKFGARYAPMYKDLFASHYNVSLTPTEFHRIVLWLDCNANELGSYSDEAGQRTGKLVWPALDTSIANPQGVENGFPVPNSGVRIRAVQKYLKTGDGIASVNIRSLRGAIVVSKEPGAAYTLDLYNLQGGRAYSATIKAEGATATIDPRSSGRRIARASYIARMRSMDGRVVATVPVFVQ